MRSDAWDAYLDALTREIRYRPDRAAIRREYEDHLQDAFDALREEGRSEEDALSNAVANMGDPAEAGRALNRSHSPLLGRLLWLMRIAVWLIIPAILSLVLQSSVMLIHVLFTASHGYTETDAYGALLDSVRIGETVSLDNHVLTFDEVRVYENGVYEIRYRDRIRLFDPAVDLSFALGPEQISGGDGSHPESVAFRRSGVSFYNVNQHYFCGFGRTPDRLLIDFDRSDLYKGRSFRITVDLAHAREAAVSSSVREVDR